MSEALYVAMGNTKGASFHVRALPNGLERLSRIEENIVAFRVNAGWERVAIRTTGAEGSKRAFILVPGLGDNEIAHGPFHVRGQFVVSEKSNNPRKAQELWRSFDPPDRPV